MEAATKGFVETLVTQGAFWIKGVIRFENDPPAHVLGERYIIGTAPTGVWAGEANDVVESDGANWTHYNAVAGAQAYVAESGAPYIWSDVSSAWVPSGTSVSHSDLKNLSGDDHTQYHNDTRGDARYFREDEHIDTSAGVSDAGKPVKLASTGLLADSMVSQQPLADHTGSTTAHDAANIVNTPSGDVTALTVQGAINELDGDLTTHIDNAAGAHAASAISYDPSTDPVTSATDIQSAMLDQSASIEERVSSMSGVVSGGDILPISATEFAIADGVGEVLDSYTAPGNTAVIDVTWTQVAIGNVTITPTVGETVGTIGIFINNLGAVLQIPGSVAGVHYRENIFLGTIYHRAGQITEIKNSPSIVKQTATDVYDLLTKDIDLTGSEMSPVDAALSIWVEVGNLYYPGVNWGTDRTNPNNLVIPQEGNSTTPVTFYPMTSDGALGAPLTVLPKQWNDIGTAVDNLTNLSGNDAVIHRLYSNGVNSREFILLIGQTLYNTGSDAKENILTDAMTYPPEISELFFLGHIGVGNDASDFTNVDRAWLAPHAAGTDVTTTITTDHTVLINRGAADQHPTLSITGLDAALLALQTDIDTRVIAGYGGIRMPAVAQANIAGAYATIAGWASGSVATPVGVTQDFANDGLILNAEGVWRVNVFMSVSFNDEASGRELNIRLYNDTDAVAGGGTSVFVGRNQAGASIAFSMMVDVAASAVGDLFVLQWSSGDGFANVDMIDAIYELEYMGA